MKRVQFLELNPSLWLAIEWKSSFIHISRFSIYLSIFNVSVTPVFAHYILEKYWRKALCMPKDERRKNLPIVVKPVILVKNHFNVMIHILVLQGKLSNIWLKVGAHSFSSLKLDVIKSRPWHLEWRKNIERVTLDSLPSGQNKWNHPSHSE